MRKWKHNQEHSSCYSHPHPSCIRWWLWGCFTYVVFQGWYQDQLWVTEVARRGAAGREEKFKVCYLSTTGETRSCIRRQHWASYHIRSNEGQVSKSIKNREVVSEFLLASLTAKQSYRYVWIQQEMKQKKNDHPLPAGMARSSWDTLRASSPVCELFSTQPRSVETRPLVVMFSSTRKNTKQRAVRCSICFCSLHVLKQLIPGVHLNTLFPMSICEAKKKGRKSDLCLLALDYFSWGDVRILCYLWMDLPDS